MGDPIGVGQHADHIFGWKGDALQRAMDQCRDFGGSCPTLLTQSEQAINSCRQQPRVDEVTEGWIPALPGCNPIQLGPGRAVQNTGCGAPTTWIGPDPTNTAPPVPSTTVPGQPPISTTPPAPGGTAAHWAQCGGIGYTGPTVCASPYTCQKQNDYYSQCL